MSRSPWGLAVLAEDNSVLDVTDDAEEAVAIAHRYSDDVLTDAAPIHLDDRLNDRQTRRPNPAVPLVGGLHDALEQLNAATQASAAPRVALRVSGLPVVTGQDILDLTDGLTDATDAYDLLYPYFGDLGKKVYETPNGLVDALIGGNEKVDLPGVAGGEIRGLTLVPFWRNMQDELVREAPEKKALLQQIEANFSTKRPPKTDPDYFNWCVGSSPACRRACLIGTGQNYMPYQFKVKFARSEALKQEPVAFVAALALSVRRFHDSKQQRGGSAFVRLNMLSDLPWELICPDLFEMLPEVQFYDYTKVSVEERSVPANYDLTFSFSGINDEACKNALQAQHRVAVVFVSGDPKRSPFSKTKRVSYAEVATEFGQRTGSRNYTDAFGVKNVPLVDGDISDYRAHDPAPSIVALSYKGPKGAPKDAELDIRYKSRFAVIVPVRELAGGLVTAHTPLQCPTTPADVD